MKARFAMLVCAIGMASAQPFTPGSFDAEMARIADSMERDPKAVIATLPPSWDIDAPTHRYTVSSGPLQVLLKAPDTRGSRQWIEGMRQHVRSFAVQPTPNNDAREQEVLKTILARKEFQDNARPSEWQLFVNRMNQMIAEWFRRLTAFVEQHPSGSVVLFWTLIVGGVVGLFAWLFRLWTESDRIPSLPAGQRLERSLRPWKEWLLDARRAAEQGDHRQAIRCGYWAGIARLQQDRAVPFNNSITPRERLRALVQPDSAVALPLEKMDSLKGLTASLERFWYAKLPVTADDVASTFHHLEGLECKPD